MTQYFVKRTLLDRINGSASKNPTIDPKTIAAYRNLYETLKKKTQSYLDYKKRLKKKLEEISQLEMCEYLEHVSLTKEIGSSSLKGFRATLLYHIYEEAVVDFEKGASITSYFETYERVRKINAKDNLAHSNKTNSPSLKFFDKDFYTYCINRLQNMGLLSKTQYLLKSFLEVNMHLGLRPHEWATARTASYLNKSANGKNGKPIKMLVVDNSKHSNGRANGKTRELLLDDLNKDTLLSISTIINVLQSEITQFFIKNSNKENPVSWETATKKVMSMTQLNMTRALNKLCSEYIEQYPDKSNLVKNTTLYSTRHQAIANAKSANMGKVIIAATFGHISTSTSKKYYGRKSNGWGKMQVRATNESIEVVATRYQKRKDSTYRPSINTNLIFNHFD
jgi:hypothetical protein